MKRITFFIFIILFSSQVSADKWRLGPNKVSQVFFGVMNCDAHTNPTNARQYPKKKLVCFLNKAKKFELELGAEKFYSSEDGNYLLGLSNNGLDRYAFWVINTKGQILGAKKHFSEQYGSKMKFYCDSTTTLVRKWVNYRKPVFTIKEGLIKDITVTSCDGKQLSLMTLKD